MSDTDYAAYPAPAQQPAPVQTPAPSGFNFADLMVDDDLSREGVWVDFYGGSRLKIASTNSPAYKSKLSKLARANKLILDDSNPENFDAVQRITAEALATTVLLDWQGIHWPNPDGSTTFNIAYTPKLGMQALRTDKFRDFVLDEAGRISNFKKEIADAAKKALGWQLRWAHNIEALMLSYERTGIVPQALASRPVLTPDVGYLMECFSLLSRHRQSSGFGVNPIPLADIVAVSAPLGFRTPSDFLFFAEMMGELDSEFMAYASEQQKLTSATKSKHR